MKEKAMCFGGNRFNGYLLIVSVCMLIMSTPFIKPLRASAVETLTSGKEPVITGAREVSLDQVITLKGEETVLCKFTPDESGGYYGVVQEPIDKMILVSKKNSEDIPDWYLALSREFNICLLDGQKNVLKKSSSGIVWGEVEAEKDYYLAVSSADGKTAQIKIKADYSLDRGLEEVRHCLGDNKSVPLYDPEGSRDSTLSYRWYRIPGDMKSSMETPLAECELAASKYRYSAKKEGVYLCIGVDKDGYAEFGYEFEPHYVHKEHQWSKWKVTMGATKNSKGHRERHCFYCGEVQTEKLDKLEIVSTSYKVAEGGTVQLDVPDGYEGKGTEIKWKSEDKSIATVTKDGQLKFKKNTSGKSVWVVLKYKDKTGKTRTIRKKFKATDKPKSMKISKTSASVRQGGSLQLIATVKGNGDINKKVTWSLTPSSLGKVSSSGYVTIYKSTPKRKKLL